MGIPTIYHIRFGRVPSIASSNSIEWRQMSRAISMAAAVIALDSKTEQTIRHHLPNTHVVKIPNGVDLSSLPLSKTSSAPAPTVLYLGWVIPTKGIRELVHAWTLIKSKGHRCLIVGAGSELYRQELLERYKPENMVFCPQVSHDEAMKLLAQSDVFVLPSYTEGFPNVIAEAMAMGKPIVASDVGAIGEMLGTDCGRLVSPQNPEALASALDQILSDYERAREMGERAKNKATRLYNMDNVFDQLVSLWHVTKEMSQKK